MHTMCQASLTEVRGALWLLWVEPPTHKGLVDLAECLHGVCCCCSPTSVFCYLDRLAKRPGVLSDSG
jgi:hypothetical protein